MPTIKLTKRNVDQISPPPKGAKDALYWDTELSRFGLRVKPQPSGVKTYVIQFRIQGRTRRVSLGKHGVITPDQARVLAQQKLGEVAHGHDPAQERLDGHNAPTVARLTEEYLDRHAVPQKRAGSIRDDKAMIGQIIIPRLGTKKVAAIKRQDVEALHVWLRPTPYKANRVLALLSKMFSLSVTWQWRPDNPAKGIKKYTEEKRERWLSEDEIRRLGAVLLSHENKRAARAILLMLLTGARKSEVLQATWDQFSFDENGGYWTKPAHFTKQKKLHGTPILPEAAAILQEMQRERDPKLRHVFPGEKLGQPLKEIKKFWKDVCEKADLANTRIHDLRHTFASLLVSRGASLHSVVRLLGHTQSQTTARYSHLAADPLRQTLKKLNADALPIAGLPPLKTSNE